MALIIVHDAQRRRIICFPVSPRKPRLVYLFPSGHGGINSTCGATSPFQLGFRYLANAQTPPEEDLNIQMPLAAHIWWTMEHGAQRAWLPQVEPRTHQTLSHESQCAI